MTNATPLHLLLIPEQLTKRANHIVVLLQPCTTAANSCASAQAPWPVIIMLQCRERVRARKEGFDSSTSHIRSDSQPDTVQQGKCHTFSHHSRPGSQEMMTACQFPHPWHGFPLWICGNREFRIRDCGEAGSGSKTDVCLQMARGR